MGYGMEKTKESCWKGSHRLTLHFSFLQERERAPRCSTLCPQGPPLPSLPVESLLQLHLMGVLAPFPQNHPQFHRPSPL